MSNNTEDQEISIVTARQEQRYQGKYVDLGEHPDGEKVVAYTIAKIPREQKCLNEDDEAHWELPKGEVFDGITTLTEYNRFFSPIDSDLLGVCGLKEKNYSMLTSVGEYELIKGGNASFRFEQDDAFGWLAKVPYRFATGGEGFTVVYSCSGSYSEYQYLDGSYVPQPIRFSNGGYHITSWDFKISKVHKILTKMDSVTILSCNEKHNPSYGPGRITLKWMPTKDQYQKIMKTVKDTGEYTMGANKYNAVIYLDFLGLGKSVRKDYRKSLEEIYGPKKQ